MNKIIYKVISVITTVVVVVIIIIIIWCFSKQVTKAP